MIIQHVVLDVAALLAGARGSRPVSQLLHEGAQSPTVALYVAACALVEADRERRGIGAHYASLPVLDVLPLDLPAALAVATATTWAFAHTLHAARPDLERPEGAFIATADPWSWTGKPVRVLDLS